MRRSISGTRFTDAYFNWKGGRKGEEEAPEADLDHIIFICVWRIDGSLAKSTLLIYPCSR